MSELEEALEGEEEEPIQHFAKWFWKHRWSIGLGLFFIPFNIAVMVPIILWVIGLYELSLSYLEFMERTTLYTLTASLAAFGLLMLLISSAIAIIGRILGWRDKNE